MVVGSGSSWLICIKCSVGALKNSRLAKECVVQPIVDKFFCTSQAGANKVIYFSADVSASSGKHSDGCVGNRCDLFSPLSHLSSAIYGHQVFSKLGYDVRLLLPPSHMAAGSPPIPLSVSSVDRISKCEMPLSDLHSKSDVTLSESALNQIGRQFSLSSSIFQDSLSLPLGDSGGASLNDESSTVQTVLHRQFKESCLGGTFDRLHNGHKQLLTAACLACSHRLTVGVTTGKMIERKALFELIEPVEQRIANVRQFIQDIDPTIEANVVPITDPFGPSIEIEDLGILVVSQETLRGGQRVNEERSKKGLPQARLHVIELIGETEVKDATRIVFNDSGEDNLDGDVPKPPVEEESKVSSSTERFHLLGELLRPPRSRQVTDSTPRPYIIGLTGGIASGKTSISHRLERLGAKIVDCDKLGHDVYEKGNPAFSEIVSHFGSSIVDEINGEINRRKLGAIVFGNKPAMEKLCSIVWPKIADLLNKSIAEIAHSDAEYNRQYGSGGKQRKSIVVVNAAILLEARWDNLVDEIWLCIVPPEIELKRVMVRDMLSEEEAKARMASQMKNEDRVSRAHVVMSTLWRRSVTQYQVEKAWRLLQGRIN